MSSLKENSRFAIDIFIFILLYIGSLSAVTYFNSSEVFDADITYINNEKMPYSVYLEIENLVDEELKYFIEIIYEKENLVSGTEKIECDDTCEVKVPIKKVFFDDYQIIIRTEYQDKHYEKKLKFELEKKESSNQVKIKPLFTYIQNKSLNITGTLLLEEESKVYIDIISEKDDSLKYSKEFNCSKICDFSIPLNSSIIFGKYKLNIYLPNDIISTEILVQLGKNTTGSMPEKSKHRKDNQINISEGYTNISVVDIFGKRKTIKPINNTITIPQGYSIVDLDNTRSDQIKLKPLMRTIGNLDELSNLSLQKQVQRKGFTKLMESSDDISINPELNSIEFVDEKIYLNGMNSYIDIAESTSQNKTLENKRKLIPGIYKYEKITNYRDGTQELEEDYFAYGLISINTKKPLYHKDEMVEMLIVVLDKWGFLISDANITLEIIRPDNETETLSSQYYEITETELAGVYTLSIISEELGHYKLYAKVELEDMVVDVYSYFNVVEEYPFDIIRDVPATIDPWQGPFRNKFKITPLLGYKDEYKFTEVFSSDFELIDTDADEIITEGDSTYLIWNNLKGKSTLEYTAQTPLVTPYLYYLGKSFVEYDKNQTFYENRSWLFAIDPAAKACDFTSPCVCGALCAGGGEPGAGTIDACGDGVVTYEFVNDIRVTSQNGSYFGTGDTVEICVDFQCDTSGTGDRITIGYKDGSAGWANGDVIYENRCDNNNINTVCQDQVLNDYVGTHHIRGKLVWEYSARPANRICDMPTYYDHDDVNITVLEKRPAYYTIWNLTNVTDIGNGLNVRWGSPITAFALWDKPIQSALLRHNGNGTFADYTISAISNNYTNYTMDTSVLTEFSSPGIVNVSYIESQDLYFNLTNRTNQRYFNLYGTPRINDTNMSPYITYNNTNITVFCQVTDEYVNIPYQNYPVNFYNETDLLGTNTTDANGYSSYHFLAEWGEGNFTITCNISSNISGYVIRSPLNYYKEQELIIKPTGTDINPPVVTDVNSSPSLASIGGVITLSATVTDDINLTDVYVEVTIPNSSVYTYPMVNTGGDIFEYDFSQTAIDGKYKYYVYAFDNSSNKGWSSAYFFEIVGIRTFIGIKSTKKVYKIGENINLTSYSKFSTTDPTVYSEEGDIDNILYTFDTSDEGWTHGGNQDEWERGVPSDADLNVCDSGNCWCTDLDNNYNNNANNWIQSPVLDMTGRTNAKISFWREIAMPNSLNDRIYFESYDGSVWSILYQNTLGANNLEGTVLTSYPSEIEGVSNARFRFRFTSDGATVGEGFTFDTVNLSFTPKQEWAKNWNTTGAGFGSDHDKITAIKISVNITDYNASGSISNSNNNPDLEFQLYNGTGYAGSYKCNLDSSKTYPYICEFVIKNVHEYIDAWNESANRMLRFRAINLDADDYIEWTDIEREIVLPSIIENHGIAKVTSLLLQQFLNSTGGIVQTMYFDSVSIDPGQSHELSTYWTFSVPGGFQLGFYSAYVALTDSFQNVLRNSDDNTYINDSYVFEVASLIINPVSPKYGYNVSENFFANLSLDITSYGSGGWCAYSFNGAANVTMNQINLTFYDTNLFQNKTDGEHTIKYYCNDSDNYMVNSGNILFNVTQAPRLNFIPPTDPDSVSLNKSWMHANVSVADSTFNSSWLEFDVQNYSMSCTYISGINHSCYFNLSGIKNGLYNYRVCANDSLDNINCTGYRVANINKTLPIITIDSPLDNFKYSIKDTIYTNISTNIEVENISCEINNNGTIFYLAKLTPLTWTDNLMLATGYYNITCYGNDSIGNNLIPVTHDFIVLPDKYFRINKSVTFISEFTYKINLTVFNNGTWTNATMLDFVDEKWSYYNFSQSPAGNFSVSGLLHQGRVLQWDIDIPSLAYYNIYYYINNSNNSSNASLSKNFLISIE